MISRAGSVEELLKLGEVCIHSRLHEDVTPRLEIVMKLGGPQPRPRVDVDNGTSDMALQRWSKALKDIIYCMLYDVDLNTTGLEQPTTKVRTHNMSAGPPRG